MIDIKILNIDILIIITVLKYVLFSFPINKLGFESLKLLKKSRINLPLFSICLYI